MSLYDNIFYTVFLPMILFGVIVGFIIGYFTFRTTENDNQENKESKYTITFEVKK